MSNEPTNDTNPLAEQADIVAAELNADVIHYCGEIARPYDTKFIDECTRRSRRENVLLILVTQGGDPDAAYRIARYLQSTYKRFILYVTGYCKSAGTLIAVGAHELVFSNHGELGPLDVQMPKKDDLWETQSGLTVVDALNAMGDDLFRAFEKFFLEIQSRSDGSITLATTAEIATNMATGAFAPLYSQIDPMHIGEAVRARSIAGSYGHRLLNESGNISVHNFSMIMAAYPSHGFVIDRHESKVLFENVRKPTMKEVKLAEFLGERARFPNRQLGELPFAFLSSEQRNSPPASEED